MTQPMRHPVPLNAVTECFSLNQYRIISQEGYERWHMHDLGQTPFVLPIGNRISRDSDHRGDLLLEQVKLAPSGFDMVTDMI